MKKISVLKNQLLLLVIFILLLGTVGSIFANEQAVKFIKLGNSYREAKDFETAEMYINKGDKLIKSTDKYWKAYAYESKGLLYSDKYLIETNKDKKAEYKKIALSNLKSAKDLYEVSIRMNKGSNDAVGTMIKNIENNLLKIENNSNSPQQLITLNFDRQKLKELPKIENNVTNVSATNNSFKQIPQQLVDAPNLSYLNLQANKISLIPDFITEFKQLEYLNLSNNKLKEVSDKIAGLENLRILDLSNNKLKKLPLSICNLKNLQVLNLRGNKLSFEEIKNLLMCLKNTNILIDKFEKQAETGEIIEDEEVIEQ
ncbi:MAG: leucine-rich repeat domain-containing protein [Candidatus Kapaibacteriota bacterium]|jgi:Leucine-rich repeat (LRR) protein